MSTDSSADLMAEVRAFLTDSYRSGGAATASAGLAFEPVGMPVSDDDFRVNQNDPTSPTSAQLAVQRTAEFSNWVPSVGADHLLDIGTRTVTGQYERVLLESQLVDTAHAATFEAFKAEARRTFDQAKLQGLDTSGAGESLQYYPVYGTPANWYDPGAPGSWRHCVIGTDPPHGSGSGSSTAHPIRIFTGHLAWRGAGDAVISSRPRPVDPHLPASVTHPMSVPPRPVTVHPGPVEVAHGDVADIVRTRAGVAVHPDVVAVSHPSVAALSLAGPTRIISTGGWKDTARLVSAGSSQTVQSSGLTMHFDYSIVRLRHPWLSMDFLNTEGWCITGMAAGALSNGTDLSKSLPFAALPTAFLAVRNLTVTAAWSEQDKEAARSAAALGSFALDRSTFDGATLSCPGIQILAWECTPLPLLPPTADPALAAKPQ